MSRIQLKTSLNTTTFSPDKWEKIKKRENYNESFLNIKNKVILQLKDGITYE